MRHPDHPPALPVGTPDGADPGFGDPVALRGEAGVTTPLQPVGRGSTGPILAGVALVLAIGLIAWHPWSGTQPDGREARVGPPATASLAPDETPTARSAPATAAPGETVIPDSGPAASSVTIPGSWTGRIAGEWSVVALLREDLLSHDPLALVQVPVAVWPAAGIGSPAAVARASCDERPIPGLEGGAILPGGEVRLLGIAFPDGRPVTVTRITGLPDDLRATRVEIAPVSGGATSSSAPRPRSIGAIPPVYQVSAGSDPVHLFALPGGVRWPDGTYRFEVATRDGLPGALLACIR